MGNLCSVEKFIAASSSDSEPLESCYICKQWQLLMFLTQFLQ